MIFGVTKMELKPLQIGQYSINPPVILAPMAGVSEAPYRVMSLELGAGLAPTELVSSKGFQYGNARTQAYIRHDPKLEPIFCVQLFGGEPEAMARAAEMVAKQGAKIIDINMGCPVKKVTRHGAGSALMNDPKRAAQIVQQMLSATGHEIPITAKMRSGWTFESVTAVDVGLHLQDAGVSALALHPRTRSQGYSGAADWTVIKALKDAVSVPVIANGDIWGPKETREVVAQTGCDAVMIGRAALGNPLVFKSISALFQENNGSNPRLESLILRHFREHLLHHEGLDRAIKKFRQHLIWYSRGFPGASSFRQHIVTLESKNAVEDAIHSFFSRTIQRDESVLAQCEDKGALG